MSGGVDSAVAALLVGEGARSRSRSSCGRDAENDAEASCCSAHAVRLARSVAHGMGMPHFTLDLRASSARASSTRSWPATRRGRRRTRASAATATCGSTRCSTSPTRSAPPTSRPATTRGSRTTGCCARPPTRPRTRPTCSPRSRRRSLARMRFPLGELTKPRGARARRARPGCRSPPGPTRRTSASSPAPARPRSSRATRGLRTARARSSTAPASVLGPHGGAHHFTVGQRKGLGVAAAGAAVRPAHRRGANRVVVGPRDELATSRGRRARRPPAPPRRARSTP